MGIYDRDWYREDYKRRQQAQEQSAAAGGPPGGIPPVKTTVKDPRQSGDGPTVLVPSVCAYCQNQVQVRLPRQLPLEYSFMCPKCGKTTVVKSAQKAKKKSYTVENMASVFVYPVMAFLFSGTYGLNNDPGLIMNIVMLCVGIALFGQAVSRRRAGVDNGIFNMLSIVMTLFSMICFSSIACVNKIMPIFAPV